MQSLPDEQNALLIVAKGARAVIGKRQVPRPGTGYVLVRNIAVALNPVDMLVLKTGMLAKEEDLPMVGGNDGAGEICALGEGVQGWSIGDKVFYPAHSGNDRGSFQQYTIVAAARMARIPPNITPEQASTIPLGLATAAIGIYKEKSHMLPPGGFDYGGAGLTPPWAPGGKDKYTGQAALVLRGSSSVGQFALQLLKVSGFNPLITTASARNEDYCMAAGATHVIDYHTTPYDQLPAIVKGIVGDVPVSFIYDAVATGTQPHVFPLLAPGGGMVVVFIPEVGKRGEDDEQGRRVVGVYGGVNKEEHHAFGAEMYANLTGMFERAELKPNNIRLLDGGLATIPAGCDELEKGVSGVKIVVRIQ